MGLDAPSAARRGCRGASGKPPAFLPEYLYPVGFSANYGPKGTGGNEGKRVSSGYNRRRRLATRSSGKQQAERTAVRTAPIVCPEESPQCARRRKPLPCPRRGLTRRLPEGVQGGERKAPCFSAGIFIPRWVFRQLRPEGDWGERREACAQWAQPPRAVSDPEFRQTTSGAHGSAGRADCLPRGKPPVRPQVQIPAPGGD